MCGNAPIIIGYTITLDVPSSLPIAFLGFARRDRSRDNSVSRNCRSIGKIRRDENWRNIGLRPHMKHFLLRISNWKRIVRQIFENYLKVFSKIEGLSPVKTQNDILNMIGENYLQNRPLEPDTINSHFILKFILLNRGTCHRTPGNMNVI